MRRGLREDTPRRVAKPVHVGAPSPCSRLAADACPACLFRSAPAGGGGGGGLQQPLLATRPPAAASPGGLTPWRRRKPRLARRLRRLRRQPSGRRSTRWGASLWSCGSSCLRAPVTWRLAWPAVPSSWPSRRWPGAAGAGTRGWRKCVLCWADGQGVCFVQFCAPLTRAPASACPAGLRGCSLAVTGHRRWQWVPG